MNITKRRARGRRRRAAVKPGPGGRGWILEFLIRSLANELSRYHQSPRAIREEARDGNLYMEIELESHGPGIEFDLCVHTARGHLRVTPQEEWES
jgi:hypothetical protein